MVVGHHVAILLVERLHIAIRISQFAGASGVDIFFVISGFVMTISSQKLMGTPGGMKTFLVRRMERVVPLYWMATTLKIALVFTAPAIAVNALRGAWPIISSYLFLSSFNDSYRYPIVPAGWTLNYEMMFYLLFAIVIGMKLKLVPTLASTLGVIGFAAFNAHWRGPAIFSSYEPIVLEFLAGVIISRLMMIGHIPGVKFSILLVFLGFSSLLLTPSGDGSIFRVFIWGIPAAAIVSGAIGLEKYLKVPGWISEIGDSSYAIYIFHGFILPIVGMAMAHIHWRFVELLTVVLCISMSTIMGIVIHKIVELPMYSYFRRENGKALFVSRAFPLSNQR